MDGHHCRGDQADRIFGQRMDHLLAPLAANQLGFALLFSHGRVPYGEPRSVQDKRQDRSAQRKLNRDPVIANRPGPTAVKNAKRAREAPSRLTLRKKLPR
jgi:hypothetical protein